MKIRVYYEDTDIGGVVYYANYLKFCERARSELFFQKGLKPVENGCHFVVTNVVASFMRPAHFSDILEVKTTAKEIRSASVVLKQEIWRDTQMLFAMEVRLAYLCGEKPSRIPEIFKTLLESLPRQA